MKLKITSVILLFLSQLVIAQNNNTSMFEEVEAYLNLAKETDADILSQNNYQTALEYYEEAKTLQNNHESKYLVYEELNNSIRSLELMNSDLDEKTNFFSDIISVRKLALEKNAPKYASSFWESGEEEFIETINVFEDKYFGHATEKIPTITNYYESAIERSEMAIYYLSEWAPFNDANISMASLLSPTNFETGLEYFEEALDAIDSDENIIYEEKLEIAESYFDLSSGIANEFALSQASLLKSREEAKMAGAELFAQQYWLTAEEELVNAGENFEDSDFEKVDQISIIAKEQYDLAKHYSNKERFLANARNQIDIALNAGANNYAPITLSKSYGKINKATQLIDNDIDNFLQVKSIAKSAAQDAEKALSITQLIKSIESGSQTMEEVILGWNILAPNLEPAIDTKYVESENNVIDDTPIKSYSTYPKLASNIEVIDSNDELVINLPGVQFAPAGDMLDYKDKETLDEAIQILNQYQNKPLTIVSYTDNIGTESYNQLLSQLRAQNIANYINASNLYESSDITILGAGESEPASENTTYEGRIKNNRVKFVVTK